MWQSQIIEQKGRYFIRLRPKLIFFCVLRRFDYDFPSEIINYSYTLNPLIASVLRQFYYCFTQIFFRFFWQLFKDNDELYIDSQSDRWIAITSLVTCPHCHFLRRCWTSESCYDNSMKLNLMSWFLFSVLFAFHKRSLHSIYRRWAKMNSANWLIGSVSLACTAHAASARVWYHPPVSRVCKYCDQASRIYNSPRTTFFSTSANSIEGDGCSYSRTNTGVSMIPWWVMDLDSRQLKSVSLSRK